MGFYPPRGLVCPASVLLFPVFTPVVVLPGAGCTLYPSFVVLSIIGFDYIFGVSINQRQRNYFLFWYCYHFHSSTLIHSSLSIYHTIFIFHLFPLFPITILFHLSYTFVSFLLLFCYSLYLFILSFLFHHSSFLCFFFCLCLFFFFVLLYTSGGGCQLYTLFFVYYADSR